MIHLLKQLRFRMVHYGKLGKSVVLDKPSHIILQQKSSIGHFSILISCKGESCSPIKLGAHSKIGNGCHILSFDGEVSIGNHCFIGGHSVLLGGGGITIGNNVLISHHVSISSSSHNSDTNITNNQYRKDIFAPVIIEDDVFIGANATILMGITIGKSSVIGAGSVVTKNVPAHQIWAGNPAKRIK